MRVKSSQHSAECSSNTTFHLAPGEYSLEYHEMPSDGLAYLNAIISYDCCSSEVLGQFIDLCDFGQQHGEQTRQRPAPVGDDMSAYSFFADKVEREKKN